MLNNINIDIKGASHSDCIKVTIHGLPKGEEIDVKALQLFVDRRKAQKSDYSTQRLEADIVNIEEGIVDGKLTGDDFVAVVYNKEQHSNDYSSIVETPRPSHADYVAAVKYEGKEDMRGGGRFSGRMTIALCIAGGIASQILKRKGIKIEAYISSIGNVESISYKDRIPTSQEIEMVDPAFRILSKDAELKAKELIKEAKSECDSVGGTIECIAYNLPVGLGGPLFDSLESDLSWSMFAIPAVKGIEFGAGFDICKMNGSVANDCYYYDSNGNVKTYTNNNGGINGGISNGMPLTLKVAFKPTPSISKEQMTINMKTHENTTIQIKGRHDACIVPRAVVCVESVVAFTILDKIL